jgi:hypothetical protein
MAFLFARRPQLPCRCGARVVFGRSIDHIEAVPLGSLTTVKFSKMPHGAAPDRRIYLGNGQALSADWASSAMACMLRLIEKSKN